MARDNKSVPQVENPERRKDKLESSERISPTDRNSGTKMFGQIIALNEKILGIEVNLSNNDSYLTKTAEILEERINKVAERKQQKYSSTSPEEHFYLKKEFSEHETRKNSERKIRQFYCDLNFAIFAMLSFAAVVILFVTVIPYPTFPNPELYISYFSFRFGLAVATFAIANRFYKLHISHLNKIENINEDISYFQRAIIALGEAKEDIDKTSLHKVIKVFSTTERNIALKKRKTANDPEQLKSQEKNDDGLIDIIKAVIINKMPTNN